MYGQIASIANLAYRSSQAISIFEEQDMNRLLGILIGLLALAGIMGTAEPATDEQTGLSVGEQAPEFTSPARNES